MHHHRLLSCLFFLAISMSASARAADPGFSRQTIDGDIQIGYGVAFGRVDADEHPDILLADKKEIVWYKNPAESGKPWDKHVIAIDLTERDNVCIAARDIDGDGLVEVAVGANWNPGETNDASKSGNLFYLQRPNDPTLRWNAVPIVPHEPTTHRMHWIKTDEGMRLAVLPLHGVGNKGGSGKTVLVSIFAIADGRPKLVRKVDTQMHMTHNFDLISDERAGDFEFMFIAGKEGYWAIDAQGEGMQPADSRISKGAGEARVYKAEGRMFAGIEPMHGTDVVLYKDDGSGTWTKEVIDTSLAAGHALAAGDLFGSDTPEIVAGWRNPNAEGKVGIKLYEKDGEAWKSHLIDDNQMACEDLKLHDFNGDGKLDILAAGRATKNLVIYWNK